MPTPESVPPRPMAAYGQSKFCAEAYCGWYERLYGLSSVTLRYGNVYGPRQDPHGEAGVIAIFCGKLLDGGRPVIFGDGRQTRDYVYVGDIVAANLAAAAHPEAHGAYNVGTGTEASVLEVLGAMRTAAGLGEGEFEPRVRAGATRRGAAQLARRDARPRRAGLHRRHRPGGGDEADARVGAVSRLGGVAASRLDGGVGRRGDGRGAGHRAHGATGL